MQRRQLLGEGCLTILQYVGHATHSISVNLVHLADERRAEEWEHLDGVASFRIAARPMQAFSRDVFRPRRALGHGSISRATCKAAVPLSVI